MTASVRNGVVLGAASALPIVLWWAAQDLSASDSSIEAGLQVLWLVQALAVPLLGTAGAEGGSRFGPLLEPASAVWTTLPLYVVVWLSRTMPLSSLLWGGIAVVLFCVTLVGLQGLIRRAVANRSFADALARSLALLVAALVWSRRDPWLSWLSS